VENYHYTPDVIDELTWSQLWALVVPLKRLERLGTYVRTSVDEARRAGVIDRQPGSYVQRLRKQKEAERAAAARNQRRQARRDARRQARQHKARENQDGHG